MGVAVACIAISGGEEMAWYLVTARAHTGRLRELEKRLESGEIGEMKPFGEALTFSLVNARIRPDYRAQWEEEDYCVPPLAEERNAVLDRYFTDIEVEPVPFQSGWEQIEHHPRLFPEISVKIGKPRYWVNNENSSD